MKQLLKQAYEAWNSAAPMRHRRERNKNYTYGNQWADLVPDKDGILRPEEEVLIQNGSRPMSNNLIRQLVKSIVGRYRTAAAENGTYSRPDIADLARHNALAEIDARMLEEFLISGCAVQRVAHEERFGRRRMWVDNVDFRRFFTGPFTDPRGWDIDLVGMLHDMPFPEVARRFAGGSREKAEKLRQIFSTDSAAAPFQAAEIGGPGADIDFFRSTRKGCCRVIEVWTLDSQYIDNSGDNPDSFSLSMRWHCRWLAPDGTLLGEYDSPYAHASHPFAIKYHPLTDGEVHSFVEDVIEQQRSINRLIVLIDKIMATSAKGVLIFPMNQKLTGMELEDVCERWAQADGVIPVTGKGEYLPQQVHTNAGASGAYQLLQLQMKLFDDISGVGDAILGRNISGVRGAEVLDAQVRNATIALADIFETFAAFTAERNAKAKG